MTLAALFRAQAPRDLASDLTEPALEAALEALVSRGRARWPALPLEPQRLVAAIAARVQSAAALSGLHAEDLHVAVACESGLAGALDAFERHYLAAGALAAALRRIDSSPAFVDEVRQALRERLFVPPPGRIAEYAGRGTLAAWTRVTALRIALDLRPRRREVQETEAQQGERAAEIDPELRFLQQKYGKQFEEAVAASFARLDDEQHNLLRLQLVDGLSTAQIAALFRVDRSTIKRRLASCREALLEHTRDALRGKLGLSTQSFESLARVLTSQLNVSVARLLKERE